LVTDIKRGTQIEVLLEQDTEENFVPKRDDVTGGWRKLHNEELHNLYSSPSIIRMIRSRMMRWVEHIARMGEKRNAYRVI
jgi:hypothetical protein